MAVIHTPMICLFSSWRMTDHYFQMNILICVTKKVIYGKDGFPHHHDENKVHFSTEKQTKLMKSAKLVKTAKALRKEN